MNTAYLPPPRSMPELYQMLPESTPVQLIGNLLVMSPAPTYLHQKVLVKLTLTLGAHVEKEGLGEMLVSPVDVYLGDKNIFQPDILFIPEENKDIIHKNGIHGAPALIIELLSSGTEKYDRKKKKAVYEEYGVKEYWLINPETRETEGYLLKNGLFRKISGRRKGIIASELLNKEFMF